MAASSPRRTILVIGPGPRRATGKDQFAHGVVSACTTFAAAGHKVVLMDNAPYLALPAGTHGIQRRIEPLTPYTICQVGTEMGVDSIYGDASGSVAKWLALISSGVASSLKIDHLGAGPQIAAAALSRHHLFAQLEATGLGTPPHDFADSVTKALEVAQKIDFPLQVSLVPCNATLFRQGSDGAGKGHTFDPSFPAMQILPPPTVLYNQSDLRQWAEHQLEVHADVTLLLEKTRLDWQRFEAIVLRDTAGHQVIAGLQAYLEPTGRPAAEAAWVQPPPSIPVELVEQLTHTSLKFFKGSDLRGAAALTLAQDPSSGDLRVIDLAIGNSRNIAFAAAASGYPLFEISARIALGKALDAVYPQDAGPSDWVAVRLPAAPHAGVQIPATQSGDAGQSLGDVMGIGQNFPEAFSNALAALGAAPHVSPERMPRPSASQQSGALGYHQIQAAAAAGTAIATLANQGLLAPWVTAALAAQTTEATLPATHAAPFVKTPVKSDVEGSFFRWQRLGEAVDGRLDAKKRHILIIAGRPNAVGQSRELDLAATQSIKALNDADCEAVVLACDPLSAVLHDTGEALVCLGSANISSVEAIHRHWRLDGVIPQCAPGAFSALTVDLRDAGLEILGTSSRALTLITSPMAMHERLTALGIPHPRCSLASDLTSALKLAEAIGFPLLLKPLAPVRGDAALAGGDTELIMNPDMLAAKFQPNAHADTSYLLEEFIEFAIEATADAICDGTDAVVPQVVEHIELAGIHSGDAAWVIPPYSTPLRHLDTISEYLRKIAHEFELSGFLSGRFAFFNDTVYLLSLDLAFSRTAAMVSEACGLPIFQAATQAMLGASLNDIDVAIKQHDRFSVREAVFPVSAEAKLASRLGPAMQSTGEVIGRADSFGMAYYKSQEAAGDRLPTKGGVLITVTDTDKPSIIEPTRRYREMGFRLLATRGTAAFLEKNGIPTETVRKLGMGRPDLVDAIKTGQVDLVINTPSGLQGQMDDSYIRKAAIAYHIPYVSTPAGALAAAKGIAARRYQEARGTCR